MKRIVRGLLESFGRYAIIVRKFSGKYGNLKLFVSPGASLRVLSANIENTDPVLMHCASRTIKPGNVVWDIGANTGLFTFAAASVAGPTGKVLAIEPDAFMVYLLNRSAQANTTAAPVQVLPVAISDGVGVKEFIVSAKSAATNFLKEAGGSTQTGGRSWTVPVVAVTLDWLLEHFPAPQVLKIDTEGNELKVLWGAKKMLAEIRPIVICEVYNENMEFVAKRFKEYGYSFVSAESEMPGKPQESSGVHNLIARPS